MSEKKITKQQFGVQFAEALEISSELEKNITAMTHALAGVTQRVEQLKQEAVERGWKRFQSKIEKTHERVLERRKKEELESFSKHEGKA